MYAVEFNAIVKDNKIEIPVQYKNKFFSSVQVIVLQNEQLEKHSTPTECTVDDVFGRLSYRANPALVEKEAGAWKEAMVKKYGTN